MNALGVTALVGGGALAAYALLRDKNKTAPGASESATRATIDAPPLGHDLATLARLANRPGSLAEGATPPSASGMPSAPVAPSPGSPAPRTPPKNRPPTRKPKNTPSAAVPRPSVRRPELAPIAAWNRSADDGGAPIQIDDDVEALARVITNEVGPRGAADERVAIGWIARNLAGQRRASIGRVFCWPCGPRTSARPFETRAPASASNRELAAIILASPRSQDPTRGATAAFNPAHQDQLARVLPGGLFDARAVRRRWLRVADYYGTVGRFDLFGPTGGAGAKPVPSAWELDMRERGIPASELE